MKRKAFLFLLPLVAAATIFTFCTKESSVADYDKAQQEQTVGNAGTVDRGDKDGGCAVTVTVNYGSVIICGTNTDFVQCGTGQCFNNALFGSAVLNAGNSATYNVPAPGSIFITDDGGEQLSNVTVTTSAGSVTTGVGVGAGAKEFCIGHNCALTMLR